jgi:hypothetical protein
MTLSTLRYVRHYPIGTLRTAMRLVHFSVLVCLAIRVLMRSPRPKSKVNHNI